MNIHSNSHFVVMPPHFEPSTVTYFVPLFANIIIIYLRCTHGMKEVSADEIRKVYGDQMLWPKFDKLKTSIYHGG